MKQSRDGETALRRTRVILSNILRGRGAPKEVVLGSAPRPVDC